MSSDDSGFDKEAEREKLREKYGDEDDRENTRRMSELLLQGATMTGKHCGECGDPIFRYDGQEFCPTCQQEARSEESRSQTAETPSDQSQNDQSRATADHSPATADQSSTTDGRTSDDEPRVEIDGISVADKHVDRSAVRRPPSQQGGSDDSTGDRRSRDSARAGGSRNRRETAASRQHASEAGDLGVARAALARNLTDLARRAEETDDAAHARELLAATREAAEALAALDRVNR